MSAIIFASIFLICLVLILTLLVVYTRAFFMPKRAVDLIINDQTQIETYTGQKLLAALSDNNVFIPSACAGAGTCGLCRVKITQGAPDTLPIEAARFTRTELREGSRLACQIVVRNDMHLMVPAELMSAERFDCKISSTRLLTPLIREVVLQLPDGLRPDVFAGSFLQITAPSFKLNFDDLATPETFDDVWQPLRSLHVNNTEDVTRAYSISNRPEDIKAGRLVLNIRLALPPPSVPEAQPGIVSSWLFSLVEDDVISVSGPFGDFKVQNTDREMIFIGGGVGMAPLRAMIFEQLEQVKTTRKLSFWYGARSKAELFYSVELDALAAKYNNFEWTAALSDPKTGDNWTGSQGFVHSVVLETYLRNHPAPENCEFYLCGPPLMIRTVFSMLDELGVDSNHIFNDDFGV